MHHDSVYNLAVKFVHQPSEEVGGVACLLYFVQVDTRHLLTFVDIVRRDALALRCKFLDNLIRCVALLPLLRKDGFVLQGLLGVEELGDGCLVELREQLV